MTITYPIPPRTRRSRRPKAPIASRLLHGVVALLFVTAGVALILVEHSARQVEVAMGAWVASHTYADQATLTYTGMTPAFAFSVGDKWWALAITAECSIAYYVGAIIILAGLFAMMTRFALWRVAVATVASALVLVLLNQGRLLALGFVFSHMGRNSFDWAHSLGGSFLMLFGLALSLFAFFHLVVRGTPRRSLPSPATEANNV